MSFYAGPLTYLALLYVESTICDGVMAKPHCHALSKWTLDKLRSRQELELRKGGLGYAPIRKFRNEDGSAEAEGVDTDTIPITDEYDREQERRECMKILDDRIIILATSIWEADMEIVKALKRFPGDSEFDRFKLEMASMIKKQQMGAAK